LAIKSYGEEVRIGIIKPCSNSVRPPILMAIVKAIVTGFRRITGGFPSILKPLIRRNPNTRKIRICTSLSGWNRSANLGKLGKTSPGREVSKMISAPQRILQMLFLRKSVKDSIWQ